LNKTFGENNMGEQKLFTPAKLVIAILISKTNFKEDLIKKLIYEYGSIDFESELIDFTFTPYYNKEMGTPIKRFFISFKDLIDPSLLAAIKIKTNSIESTFIEDDGRKINLDPGILFLSRFILASTKDGSYRIPLSSGIYGEITLVYEKSFKNVELTYPDFKSETYKSILSKVRDIYKIQLQSQ
jgi:hypothetical protein